MPVDVALDHLLNEGNGYWLSTVASTNDWIQYIDFKNKLTYTEPKQYTYENMGDLADTNICTHHH